MRSEKARGPSKRGATKRFYNENGITKATRALLANYTIKFSVCKNGCNFQNNSWRTTGHFIANFASFSRQQSGAAVGRPGSQHRRRSNLRKLRTRFEEFEAKGKKLSECDHYSQDIRRVRQRNHRYDEPGTAPELTQTPVDKFRTGTFLVIIDNVDAKLKKRPGAYAGIAARFGFLRKLKNLPR